MKTYDIGDVAVLDAEWKDDTGAYADPSVVTLSVTLPDGTVLAYIFGVDVELICDEQGKYHVDLPITLPGFYQYHFSSENPVTPGVQSTLQAGADEWLYGIDRSIELTTLSHCKDWAEVKTDGDDRMIQVCIAAFGRYALSRTGRDTLSQKRDFTEVYDGNGSAKMLLRNYPIVAVSSVMINGAAAIIAPGYGVSGISIIEKAKGIGFGFGSPGSFYEGIANIQVIYRAGYDYVPEDLEQAACEAVAINYKRKAHLDLKSHSISIQGGAGTTAYQSWALTPQIENVLNNYTRRWMV